MDSHLTRTRKRPRRCYHEPVIKKTRAKVHLADLSEDLLSVVLSKLPIKDAVRTGLLSSKWRHMSRGCSKLKFDGFTVCGSGVFGGQEYTQKFIDNVNAVMRQQQCMVVEELVIRFGFDIKLVDHVNTWVDFAVSSRTKSLALDLAPAKFRADQYRFPVELLDDASLYRLRHLQLSFASFELPCQFSGFPNLRTLDLHMLRVTRKDLQDTLSNCVNLEWFSMVRCHLNDELTVGRPLSKLLYLRIVHCKITKIVLNAVKLETFIFYGRLYPVDLGGAPELKHADLDFYSSVPLEHALTVLPKVLSSVQDLTLRALIPLKMPLLMETPYKFSQLKHLDLWLIIEHKEAGNILSLASFLRAAPYLEKLEMHFSVFDFAHRVSHPIKILPRCPHDYLKSLHITGFSGTTSQLELLVHTVENAHALEFLTIKGADIVGRDLDREGKIRFVSQFKKLERRYLHGIISPNVKLCII
ncbi:putative FBD-associated F-box protein At1g61330 [Lolium rigidum]|uniref:putative FBD-associated F-box protein At1g61330 n=1 Tax=Lolium rigidum TaxID=89674 RepID=UPI001F5C4887|nr:putative FBD-associated F-box protein At1g61330 [Lolium rigidum]